MDIDHFRNKKVLITGGTGFIGKHLSDRLSALNAKIHILDQKQSSKTQNDETIVFHEVNILENEGFNELISYIKPDIIFHLAASLNRERDFARIEPIININIKATVKLLTALKGIDYQSFIFASTGEVYGNNHQAPFREDVTPEPVSPYSATKYSAENFCKIFSHIYNKPVCILRLFNVYGEGQDNNMFIPQLIHACINEKSFNMSKGDQIRDYIYIADVVDAFLLASAKTEFRGEVFNIGSGNPTHIKDLAEMIITYFQAPATINYGALNYRENEIWELVADNWKAKKHLKWEIGYSLDEGLKKTISSYIPEL